jgi:hypothetical protein
VSNDLVAQRFVTDFDDMEFILDSAVEKANPNHDPSTGRFTSGGGGGGGVTPDTPDSKINETYFESKADKAYGTGTDDEFTIHHTGDESVASLGTYLAQGHTLNDLVRYEDNQGFDSVIGERPVGEIVAGLDNAIEMAPRMPKQTVFRVGSQEAVSKLRKGSTYVDRGYTSTTAVDITQPENGIQLLTLAKISPGQKTIMRIDTGKVGKGLYMPKMFPGQPIAEFEKEFLMPRSTKMKYMGEDYLFLDNGSAITIHDFKVVE